jgi:hypothetical protein
MTHHPDPNASDAWRAREVLQSGLGQVANANWCGSQIEAFEEARGVTFDVIFKNRPDGYFPEPISPFCAWDLSKFCAARDWQGRTRERNSQLQRLLSRPFSTRFG